MFYVYILENHENRFYVGLTDDLRQRVADHNDGKSVHTAKFKPWRLRTYFAFDSPERAAAFERYLKSRSGRAFQKRHF